MSDNRLPTEVELAYEVMPCQALHTAQVPGEKPHPCSYFQSWGTYYGYAYESAGPPPKSGIVQKSQYVGRAHVVPEMLSGCRKAPIMAVGINPNLPGWWPATRNSINPLFDECKQYAHYFRYRETDKLEIPSANYKKYLHGRNDLPLKQTELDVPVDESGFRTIPVELQPVAMYENYQSLLEDLAKEMGWKNHRLSIGEDVSYGNMVACPSAKWINRRDPKDPTMPPMTTDQQRGIVAECFHHRRYFLRQLFQSLPAVLMVFSQSTTDAFIAEMTGRFTSGNPKLGDSINDLVERDVRLQFGTDRKGQPIDAQVIFSPHITGDPEHFKQVRAKVLAALVKAGKAGRLVFNTQTGHLQRPPGACVFCTMLEIGPCDYEDELIPLAQIPSLTAGSSSAHFQMEKDTHLSMLKTFVAGTQAAKSSTTKPSLAKLSAVAVAASPEKQQAALAATNAAFAGWKLSGNPTRQKDRKPPH